MESLGIVTKVYSYPEHCVNSLTGVTEVPGKGMGILQNLQRFRVRAGGVTDFTEVPGIVTGVQNSEKLQNDIPVPRVFVALAYVRSRSSACGYGYRTELPEVRGMGMDVLQNLRKLFVG